MKFAIKFYQGCRILPDADEIIIQYNEKNPNLIKFVQEYKDNQRIVVNITELADIEDNLNIFEAAYKAHPQFAILLSYKQNVVDIAEMNIPFFFIEGASNMDDVMGMLHLGVTDLYVMNELAFNIKNISQYCHKNNVAVRVYPNVAQSSTNFSINTLTKFFIRPDAVKIYEPYVDIFEFFGPLDRQPVLYDIYRDERWLGMLDEVVIGLNKNIDNQTIVPYFDVIRTDCRKVCGIEKCNICGAAETFGKTLKTKEIGIKRKKAVHNDENNQYRIDEEFMSADSIAAETNIDGLLGKEVSEDNSN